MRRRADALIVRFAGMDSPAAAEAGLETGFPAIWLRSSDIFCSTCSRLYWKPINAASSSSVSCFCDRGISLIILSVTRRFYCARGYSLKSVCYRGHRLIPHDVYRTGITRCLRDDFRVLELIATSTPRAVTATLVATSASIARLAAYGCAAASRICEE